MGTARVSNIYSYMECSERMIKITSNLDDVYPSVGTELGSRHHSLVATLREDFTQLYEDFPPEHIVFVRAVADVVNLGPYASFSFAVENGITLLLSRTYEHEEIFLNGNIFHQELIFDVNGKHREGISQFSGLFTKMVSFSRIGLKEGQFFGAILNLHCNIPEQSLHFSEILNLALFIGALIMSKKLQQLSSTEIGEALLKINEKLDRQTVLDLLRQHESNRFYVSCKTSPMDQALASKAGEFTTESLASCKQLGYHRTKDSMSNIIQMGDTEDPFVSLSSFEEVNELKSNNLLPSQVTMGSDLKLILCKLELSSREINQFKERRNNLKRIYESIARKFTEIKQEKEEETEDEYERMNLKGEGEYLLPPQSSIALDSEEQNYLDYYLKNKKLLVALQGRVIMLPQYLQQKWEIDSSHKIHSADVLSIVSDLKLEVPCLKECVLIDGDFMLATVPKVSYADTIYALRQLLTANRLSTNTFLNEQVNSGWEKGIHDFLFAATPSLGVIVYSQ